MALLLSRYASPYQRKYARDILTAESIYFYQTTIVLMPVGFLHTVSAAFQRLPHQLHGLLFTLTSRPRVKLFQAQSNSLFLFKQIK